MSYRLVREHDGAGDSGFMSRALDPVTLEVRGHRPQVGCAMQVGSPYARTYEEQDWWCTTPVTEILEESEHRVRFHTGNSVYVWEEL